MNNNSGTVKVITILDYIGILFILGLFVEKDNEDVRFHTNQGLILFLFEIVVNIAGFLLALIPFIGGLLQGLLGLLCVVFMILGIVNAAQGQRKPLPVIGTLFQFIK